MLFVYVCVYSVAKPGGRATAPPLARRKKEKEGKNALSTHLRGLFAAIGVSNDFYSNTASVIGGGGTAGL